MKTVIKNARIITPYETLENHWVQIEDGKITDIGQDTELIKKEFDNVIDAKGNYLAPGFIDIHNHGNSGHDAMEGTSEALDSMAAFHLKHGVTGFLATTVTASRDETKNAIKNAVEFYKIQEKELVRSKARLLGIYLEGPYFSITKKGAQPAQFIRNPDRKELTEFLDAGLSLVKVVSLAPELPNAKETVSYLKSLGIAVAAGHSDATFAEAKKGIDWGITLATHIFNGMRSFSHREPGVVGAMLTDERVFCEMICDGIHLHPTAMKLVVKMKGKERVVLISDAMMACGLPAGDYSLGGQRVTVTNGEARLADGTLAGSTLTLDRAVYNMIHLVGIPLPEAVRMATLNPAQAIGIQDSKGSIDIGKDADLIIFDEQVKVLTAMVGGKVTQFNQ